jgi:hypothetical protein
MGLLLAASYAALSDDKTKADMAALKNSKFFTENRILQIVPITNSAPGLVVVLLLQLQTDIELPQCSSEMQRLSEFTPDTQFERY